jgi:hypothetical protein
MSYPPHPGSDPQSSPMLYRQMPDRHKGRTESNQIADHPAGNSYPGNGGRYYEPEFGSDNKITQPTSGLTDVDVGFPPMLVVPTGDYPIQAEMDITHGRVVVGKIKRVEGLPPRGPDARKPWAPKGRGLQYRSDSKSREGKGRNPGPGGSSGYNTYQ